MTMSFKSTLKRILSYSPYTYKLVAAVVCTGREFPKRFVKRCILSIPLTMRYRVARLLRFQYSAIAEALDNIPADCLAKTVLFVVRNPHSRETRMAEAAIFAGWHPIMVYTGNMRYAPDKYFQIHAKLRNLFQLILVVWLFRGPLIHVFASYGYMGYIFSASKTHPVILDIYDTCSGFLLYPKNLKLEERNAIQLSDGITHRDLRVKYLHELHGYLLPKHNILITDILPEVSVSQIQQRRDGNIHVVSTGSIGSIDSQDLMILRTIEALCKAGIHVHLYGDWKNPEMADYRKLQERLEYLHLEQKVYGNTYWEKISRYDFGLSILEPFLFDETSPRFTIDYLQGSGSSRLMDYIRMNLGVIISPYPLRFQYFLARRYAPAVVPATVEFLQNPRPILEKALRQKAKGTGKNLSAITTQRTALRLGDFYTKVAKQV